MHINKDNFTYIANAVKLSFTDKDEKQITKELNKMLEYIDTMKELDTSNVKPLTHVLPQTNVFREDEVICYDTSGQLNSEIDKIKVLRD
ncbi:MAG: Asp-tRNA(Asn)/Glu-tRNA(Gln) amidotransferase subunit GatC [Clostridiales bacterium]|nr:Asp-tRNA(Asn)/Glu-tRNA(Gln) amidotransferase subunit GatC [Clostridiales bacterium]